jgi:HEAT repeat protein
LLGFLEDPDEKIRNAAAFAVGGVVAGNVDKYFSPLLALLQEPTTNALTRSLVLHAIKEVLRG